MDFEEYRRLDGIALSNLLARRQVNRQEIVECAIDAINTVDRFFNSVILRNFEAALERLGRKSDGRTPSALDGVPFLLKDVNLYDSEMPTRFASRFFRDAEPRGDSAMVSRWRAAGLVFLGKTNTPEFAGEFITEPACYGPALNPWNVKRTTGGSSGGAAVAVALGLVPVAHATDLGGSIRIPAACCGVFGFKPTSGLNPLGPFVFEIAGGLDSDHVISRTVRDSAASLNITADSTKDFQACLDEPLRQLRIGVTSVSPEGLKADPDQSSALNYVARQLEAMGHEIVEYEYPADSVMGVDFDLLWMMDVYRLVEEHSRAIGRSPSQGELEPLSLWAFEKIRTLGAAAYYEARLKRKRAGHALEESMAGLDIVLTPTLATDPPPVGFLSSRKFENFEEWARLGYEFAPFSTPANIAGQPSASIPAGFSSAGLPVGVQATARRGEDGLVLQLSAAIEKLNAIEPLAPLP